MSAARRTKADLIKELHGLDCGFGEDECVLCSKDELCNRLRNILAPDCIPDQVNVMLAQSSEKHMDMDSPNPWLSPGMVRFWDHPRCSIEQKLDGVRAKLHFYRDAEGSPVCRMDGRNRSTKTYACSEFTLSLPHICKWRDWHEDLFRGTIIDGELLMPAESIWTGKVQTDSVRYSSIVVTNAGTEVALQVQAENGNCLFFPFDVIKYQGHWCITKPLYARAGRLEHFLTNNKHPDLRPVPGVGAEADKEAKISYYLSTVLNGGEGVIIKCLDAPYEFGKRRSCWLKVKRFETAYCYVTDYKPGEHGFEGMIGALEGAVIKDGEPVDFCAVSGFTLVERQTMTDKTPGATGMLKAKYYGRVMQVRYQDKSKTGRAMHARFIKWCPEKTQEDCKVVSPKSETAT